MMKRYDRVELEVGTRILNGVSAPAAVVVIETDNKELLEKIIKAINDGLYGADTATPVAFTKSPDEVIAEIKQTLADRKGESVQIEAAKFVAGIPGVVYGTPAAPKACGNGGCKNCKCGG